MRLGRVAVILGALALLLAACGGDELAERIIESQEGVGDVEIDESTGSVVVEFEDEEGEGSVSFGGGEIPDDFPVPVPNGGDVQQVASTPDGASVSLFFPRDEFDSLKEFYSDWSSSQSDDVSTFESTNPLAASWNFQDGSTEYIISLTDIGETGIALNIVVSG